MWRGGSLRVPVPDVGSSVLGFMQTFMHRDWSRPAPEGWRHGGSAFRIIIIDGLIDPLNLIDPLGCNRGNGAIGEELGPRRQGYMSFCVPWEGRVQGPRGALFVNLSSYYSYSYLRARGQGW